MRSVDLSVSMSVALNIRICIKRLRGSTAYIWLVMLCCLSGCREFIADTPYSEIKIPKKFDQTSSAKPEKEHYSLSEWWRRWNNQQLNSIISTALVNNSDITIARARVLEARSSTAIAEGSLLPTVGINSRIRGGPVKWYNARREESGAIDTYLSGLTGTWEPDLFGGRADDASAARFYALSLEEQLHGMQLLVITEVAHNYFALINLMKRQIILDQSVIILNKLLEYTSARFNAGQAGINDKNLIREQLSETNSKRDPLIAEIEIRRRRILVLSGVVPENKDFKISTNLKHIPRPPLGELPSDVLNRRPDVRARLDAVNAQLSRLNSAKKDLLPRFQINFFGGSGKLQFGLLPGSDGLAGLGTLAGLTVYLPIFTAGRIEANIAMNDASLHEALAEYNKSILQALEEVENAYSARLALERRTKELMHAMSDANSNAASINLLYNSGRKTLGDYLNSRLILLNRADQYTMSLSELESATIRLYASLGGGWQ